MSAFLWMGMWVGSMVGAFAHHLIVKDVNNHSQNIIVSNVTIESPEGNACMETRP